MLQWAKSNGCNLSRGRTDTCWMKRWCDLFRSLKRERKTSCKDDLSVFLQWLTKPANIWTSEKATRNTKETSQREVRPFPSVSSLGKRTVPQTPFCVHAGQWQTQCSGELSLWCSRQQSNWGWKYVLMKASCLWVMPWHTWPWKPQWLTTAKTAFLLSMGLTRWQVLCSSWSLGEPSWTRASRTTGYEDTDGAGYIPSGSGHLSLARARNGPHRRWVGHGGRGQPPVQKEGKGDYLIT